MFLTRCCYCIPLNRGCEIIAAITIIISIVDMLSISSVVKAWMISVVVLVYLVVIALSVFFIYVIEKQWILIVYVYFYIYWAYAVIYIAMALTIQIKGEHFMLSVLKKPGTNEQLQKMANGKNVAYFMLFLLNLYFSLVSYSFYRQERYGTDEDDDDESEP